MHDFNAHALDVYWLLVGTTYKDTVVRLLLLSIGLPLLVGFVIEFRIIPLSPRQRPTMVFPLGFAIIGLAASCNMARASEPSFATTAAPQLIVAVVTICVSVHYFNYECEIAKGARRHLFSEVSLLHHFVAIPAFLYVAASTTGIVVLDCFSRGLDGRGLDLTVAIISFACSAGFYAYGVFEEECRRDNVERMKFRYRDRRRFLFTNLR